MKNILNVIDIIGLLGFLVGGVLLFIGAYRKNSWLVDPPESYWLIYSQSFIKKFFGKKVLLCFTYFFAIVFIISSVWLIWVALFSLYRTGATY